MPVAKMLVDSAAGYEYLSMLDGYSGYNQIFIADEDVPKTAFRCPGALGTYEWVVMPFGLKNVGATYQRAMNAMFHDFIEHFMQIYIDDIVIKSSSENESTKMCFLCTCRRFLRIHSAQKRHRDQSKQNKSNFGSQTSFDKETVAIFVGENQLLEEVYFKYKWQDKGFLAIAKDQEGK